MKIHSCKTGLAILRGSLAPVSFIALAALQACSRSPAAAAASERAPSSAATADGEDATCVRDVAEAAPYLRELIDLAFRTAGSLPLDPHVKTRSRLEESVADAALELGLARRASEIAEAIPDWRRGKCYADLAFYAAQHHDSATMQRYVDLANQVIERWKLDDDAQDWQVDRIKVGVAKSLVWIGHADEAARTTDGAVAAELSKVEAVKARLIPEDQFESYAHELETLIASKSFDPTQSALETCAQLYDRFYSDPERRAWVETQVRKGTERLPLGIRIDLTLELAGFAADHHDSAHSLELVDETRRIVDGSNWLPENHAPIIARIGAARERAGDHAHAKTDVAEALALYDLARERITDIWRAGALRPVAEATLALGDREGALKLYRRVADEGAHNPNSRPRAEDLVATCLSLASHRLKPDDELAHRLQEIADGLGTPW